LPTRHRLEGPAAACHRFSRHVLRVARVRDPQQLYAFLTERAGALSGVQAVETVPTLRRVKALTAGRPPAASPQPRATARRVKAAAIRARRP
jgi:DNA-binding Lrp family transcriptional regulator